MHWLVMQQPYYATLHGACRTVHSLWLGWSGLRDDELLVGGPAEPKPTPNASTPPFAAGALTAEPAAPHADEAKAGSDDGKKGHRRGRSLSAMLNPLKLKGRRGSTAADDLDVRALLGLFLAYLLMRQRRPEAAPVPSAVLNISRPGPNVQAVRVHTCAACKVGITKPSIGHLKACVLLPPLQLSNLNLDERSLRSNADMPPRPKTPDPAKRASSGALGCFGVGPRMADDGSPAVVRHNAYGGASEDEREPSLPSGLIGMKNLGASLSSGKLLYMCRGEESRAGQKCRAIRDQQQGHAAVQVLPSFFTCCMQVRLYATAAVV